MSNDTIPPWLREYLEHRLRQLYDTKLAVGNNTGVKARIDEIDRIFAQEEH